MDNNKTNKTRFTEVCLNWCCTENLEQSILLQQVSILLWHKWKNVSV